MARDIETYENNYTAKREDYGSRQNKPFFVLLVIITVTSLVFVLSAGAVLVYFRIRHGPKMFHDSGECPGNQVWRECSYDCKVSCEKEFTRCESECLPGCECPEDLPIWHYGKCIHREDCNKPIHNYTASPDVEYKHRNDENDNNNPVLEPDSDTLLQGGKSKRLTQFMNTIWNLDQERFGITNLQYNLQGKTNVSSARDVATGRLFPQATYSILTDNELYTSFIELFGHYNKHLRQPDPDTEIKNTAIKNFLDIVLKDPIMQKTEIFLKEQGLVSSQPLRQTLLELWFSPYSRSPRHNISDSSGFENVFVGEVRKRKIIGLHNWVRFYLLEKNHDLNYYGYIQAIYLPQNKQVIAVNVKYVWENQRRKQGSFLVGTSPVFDMATYTVCFLLHPNRPCLFDLDTVPMDISTYDVKHVPGWQIETAYPVV